MANAKTGHSKTLRQSTAAKWQKNLTAANRFEVRSKDTDKIAAIRAGLAEVEGADNADKLLNLINLYKDIKMEKLFEQLQNGWKKEQTARAAIGSIGELRAAVNQIAPADAMNALEVARAAGRYQAYFGKALDLRTPLNEAGTEFDPEETAAAEEFDVLLAMNFAVAWKNVLYLKSLGK